MSRRLLAALLVVWVTVPCAGEDGLRSTAPDRRAAIEAKLDAPLNWPASDAGQVTLGDVLAHIRQEHGLTVRWDTAALGVLYGDESPFSDLLAGHAVFRSVVATQQPCYVGPSVAMATGPVSAGTYQPNFPYPATNPYGSPTAAVYGPQVAGPQIPGPLALPPQIPGPQDPAAQVVAQPNGYGTPALATPPGPAEPTVLVSPQDNLAPPPQVEAPADPAISPDVDAVVESESEENVGGAIIKTFLNLPVSVESVALEGATVREGLRQILDAVSGPTAGLFLMQFGIPVTSRALGLDLLVDQNSVLITTQLRANSHKETRVYRLDKLGDLPPEALVRVITHSVRPWSWRGQADEIATQLAARWPKSKSLMPFPLPKFEVNVSDGINLSTKTESGGGEAVSAVQAPEFSDDTVAATGQLLAGGALATVQSIVAALEIVHHGDPPTGVIEVLPGMLIITQSQAAHREIQELLDALRDDE